MSLASRSPAVFNLRLLLDFDRNQKQGFEDLSFDSPTDMIGEAVRRYAGQPFPEEIQRIKDALYGGVVRVEDDSAQISISPGGQLEIRPKTSNWNMGLDPINKGIRIGYDSSQTQPKPEPMPEQPAPPSAGQVFADEMIRKYRKENPDWYRP